MNTENKTILLEITADQYEQLARIAALLQSLNGSGADVNDVAVKLLLHSLREWNKPGSLSGDLDKTITGHEQTPQDQEHQETVSPALVQVADQRILHAIPQQPKPINWTEKFLVDTLQGVEPGARIALIGNDVSLIKEWTLRLTQNLANDVPVLYIDPDSYGQFSELIERAGIPREELLFRVKMIHFLPDTPTQWKRHLTGSGGRMMFGAVVFDFANGIVFEPDFMQMIGQIKPNEGYPYLTQVYTFLEDSENIPGETFLPWMDLFDVVLAVHEGGMIQTVKNTFPEKEQ